MALWGVSEIDGLNYTGTPVVDTNAGRFEAGEGRRSAVHTSGGGTYLETPDVGQTFTDFWVHCDHYVEATIGSTGNGILAVDSTGTGVFRMETNSSWTMQPQYWNGSGWVNIGAANGFATFSRSTIDIRVQIAGGDITLDWWVNQAKVSTATVTQAANAIQKVRFYRRDSNAGRENVWSQMIWGDQSTLGHKVLVAVPTAEGFHTDGDSDHTSVDENGAPNDSDLNSLSSATDRQSFTHGALTVPSTLEVKSVCIGTRLAKTGGGPQNAEAFLRIGGTDYDHGGNFTDIDFGQSGYIAAWQTNPATAAGWTNAEAVDVTTEFGIEAVA